MGVDLSGSPFTVSVVSGFAVWAALQLWKRVDRSTGETLPVELQQIRAEVSSVGRKLDVIANDIEHHEKRLDEHISNYKSLAKESHELSQDYNQHMRRHHGGT